MSNYVSAFGTEALENDSRNYISWQEYLDICEVNGFKKLPDKLQPSQRKSIARTIPGGVITDRYHIF